MKKIDTKITDNILENVYVDDNTITQNFHQDITQLLEENKQKRNAVSSWKKYDPKAEMHQVLDLSMTDVMRIKNEHGVDILGRQVDWKYVFKLIETHYPYMKTTTARL